MAFRQSSTFATVLVESMRKLALLLLILAVLGGGVWMVWDAGQLSEALPARAEVTDLTGTVEVKAPGESWRAISEPVSLVPGTEVRTGAASHATLRFFDRGETRLAPNTSVTVASVGLASNGDDPQVEVELTQGRVWSRVLRLLDLDADYTVKTSDVVATVRGTAFDLEKTADQSELWVSHAAVQAIPAIEAIAEADPKLDNLVPEGFMQTFGRKPNATKMLPIAAKDDAWRANQRAKDEAFLGRTKEQLRTSVQPKRPGMLARWSQVLRERMMGQDDRLGYVTRVARAEAYELRSLADAGSQGEANTRLRSMLQTWKERGDRMPVAARRQVLATAWRDFEDVGPLDPAYRLKLQLEEAMLETIDQPSRRLYGRMILMDARLDETSALVQRGKLEDAKRVIEVVKNGVPNVERDWKERASEMEKTERRRLLAKVYAIQARMKGLEGQLASVPLIPLPEDKQAEMNSVSSTQSVPMNPSGTQPTSTKPPVTTGKPPVNPTTPPTNPTPTPTTDVACTQLLVSVQPSPISLKERATVFATVIRADGSKQDVSSKVSVKLYGAIGSVSGNVITGTSVGSATVEATYPCAGTTVAGQTSLSVIAPTVSLEKLLVESGNSLVPMFGSTGLSATALYSDGTRKDVTGQVSFFVSDGGLGTMRGATFFAGQMAGSGTISASYSENGVRVSGSTGITVYTETTKP